MKTKTFFIATFLLTAILLVSCSSQVTLAGDNPASEVVIEEIVDEMMSEDENKTKEETSSDDMSEHKDDAMADNGDSMEEEKDDTMADTEDDMKVENDDSMADGSMDDAVMAPDWFNAPLTDARTGETYTIADFKGKVVLVETLAMWCSNCLKQQREVLTLHEALGERDDFISLGVDIDPYESAEALKSYTDNNNFTWHYTIAPVEVAREIGQLYGDQYLNPPATPMLIIDKHGEAHTLPFGIKSTEDLLEALQPFLDESM